MTRTLALALSMLLFQIWTVLANDHAELRKVLDQHRDQIKKEHVVVIGEWWLAYGEARIRPLSSAAKTAGLQKARLVALGAFERQLLLNAVGQELRSLPTEWRDQVLSLLLQNSSSAYSAESVIVLDSGEDGSRAWAFVAVEAKNLKRVGVSTGISSGLLALMTDPVVRVSPDNADYFYEAACHYGIKGARDAWVRFNPVLFQPMIRSGGVDRGLRQWVDNESTIKKVSADLSSVAGIKKMLMLVPFNADLLAKLSASLRAAGLENTAREISAITPIISDTSDASIGRINPQLLVELDKSGLGHIPVVRVIVTAKGQFPSNNEPLGNKYAPAFDAYKAGNMEQAMPFILSALVESYNADTINLIGAMSRRRGFPLLGSMLCLQAYQMSPSHPYAAINLALSCEDLKQKAIAIKYAEIALQNPGIDNWTKNEANRILSTKVQ